MYTKRPVNRNFVNCGYKLPLSHRSSFEHVVATLGLLPGEYVGSAALKEWVRRNKDYRYVPPELLAAWRFTVNVYAA